MSSLRRVTRDLNAFVRPADLLGSKHNARAGPLSAYAIAVKDNICTLDHPTTCASKALNNYKSPFEATVVSLLRDAGASIIGKTNLDEFGMGSHSVHSSHGAVKNALDIAKSAGGSSGGSAVAVATNQCNVAIGTDTGGSVRLPAAYNGVIGFKPSYGLVSRWGIIPYANSLDTVGFLAKTIEEVRQMFRKTNRHDTADPTSLSPKSRDRLRALQKTKNTKSRRIVIGVPTDYNITSLEPQIRSAWILALQRLQSLGHLLSPVSLHSTRRALPAYYILAPAEASSNLAKYDGVQYGETRGESFGPEVQRRILLGAYSLSASAMDNYFLQAQKIRRLVIKDFNKTFSSPNILFPSPEKGNADIIFCPTAPTAPPPLEDILGEQTDPSRAYMNDVFTVPASLAGLPALSVPFCGVGMQAIGQYGDDDFILDFGEGLMPHSS